MTEDGPRPPGRGPSVVTDLLPVEVVPHVWIPLSDGTRLSARLWLPDGADPAPALLEYLPYRKDDFTASRDARQHGYFAGHGYACVRVDLRGTGDSDGICRGEYLGQELADAEEVIAWIAAQPWCDGNVGMFGISWGGFNSLQVAARRPPALRAIIAVAATDDRYATDVHYMGGCVIASEMLPWAATMLAYNARPPTRAIVGNGWREQWLDRLRRTPRYIEDWLSNQRRDGFWEHGSVCEDYAAIECPVFVVGGLADGYSDPVFRLVEGLQAPAIGLLGPWAHLYPEVATPGPAIGFLQEALRWWDHWLRGVDTGIMGEDRLRVWMQDRVAPATGHEYRPGRWIGVPGWPPGQADPLTLWPSGTELARAPGEPGELSHRGAATHGLAAGSWWSTGFPADFPADQRADDDLALTFTSEPIDAPIELLGFPEVALRVRIDAPCGVVTARLCDVAPDGSSYLVARGVLNLTHRAGHAEPQPVVPGEIMDVRFRLDGVAHVMPAGHRWRLAISTTLWPLIWPSSHATNLTVLAGDGSSLDLPVRPADDGESPVFPPPETAFDPVVAERPESCRREVEQRDGSTWVTYDTDHGAYRLGTTGFESSASDRYFITDGDPLSARATCTRRIVISWGLIETTVETRSEMWADAAAWYVTNSVVARENGMEIFAGTWEFEAARDHV